MYDHVTVRVTHAGHGDTLTGLRGRGTQAEVLPGTWTMCWFPIHVGCPTPPPPLALALLEIVGKLRLQMKNLLAIRDICAIYLHVTACVGSAGGKK